MQSEHMKSAGSDMKHQTKRRGIILLCGVCGIFIIFATVMVCAILIGRQSDPKPSSDTYLPRGLSTEQTILPTGDISLPAFLTDKVTEPPETNPPETEPPVYYDFGAPVPESDAVADDYFSDAVFIGDSRTVGLGNYSGIKSTYYAKVSLNIYTALTTRFIDDQYTILEAIEKDPSYKKVYLWFGLNELGMNAVSVISTYKHFISQIRELLPDAEIYVQSIIPVSQHVSDTSKYGVTNKNVQNFNRLLQQMCKDMQLFYLDTASEFCDENGVLPAEYSNDGIHLKSAAVKQLFEYFKKHTVTLPVTPKPD